MSIATINLAYCIDNVQRAESLAGRLTEAGFQVNHVYGKADSSEASLSEQLQESPYPTLLLLTDNFLKSVSCMKGGLQLLQRKKEDMLPIVADGFDRSEPDQPVPTRFERVSDIIQYINYWQEQYLDLRRQKKQLQLEEEEAFHQYLRDVRSISGEAGEYLRLLRHMPLFQLEEFEQEALRPLYDFLGKEEHWPGQEAKGKRDEQEQGPPEIRDIPGIDLLQESPEAPEAESPAGSAAEESDPEERPQEETALSAEESEQEPAEADAEDPALVIPYHRIDRLVERGQHEEALDLLNAQLEEYPQDPRLLYQKAVVLSELNRASESMQVLDHLLQGQPAHVEGRFLRAELSNLAGTHHQARYDYEQVLELEPEHRAAVVALGLLLARHFPEETEEAARLLERALDENDPHPELCYQYGKLLNGQPGREEEAIRLFEQALDIDPAHKAARIDLARLLKESGQAEAARRVYEAGLADHPELDSEELQREFQPEEGPDPAEDPSLIGLTEDEPVEEAAPAPEQAITNQTQPDMNDENQPPAAEPDAPREDPSFPPDAEPEPQEEPQETNTIAALKENLEKLEALLAERRRREREQLEAMKSHSTQEKTVLITGASSGIGYATARKFAENGYRVIITGRRNERLADIKQEFEAAYEQAALFPLCFDVRDRGSIQLALDKLPEEWKTIDILINNAGKAKGLDPIHEGQVEHWNEMIDTNLKGLLYLTRAISPAMVERGQGHIINVGSTAGKEVYPKGGVYCATKFAVDALTKGMRLDLHQYGIRVGQVSPGHVEETEFAKVRFDGDEEKAKIYEDFQPLKAGDVAEAIYFLATQPPHVNIQDILLMGTQQASSLIIDRSGRNKYE